MSMKKQEGGSKRLDALSKEELEREPEAHFAMDLARHSSKGKLPDGREPITTEGMEAAVKAGLERQYAAVGLSDQSKTPLYGSPRERTLQSSILRGMARKFKEASFRGSSGTVQSSDLDPRELVDALKEAGLETMETQLLNFALGKGQYKEDIMAAFNRGEYLKYLVENSDEAAKKYRQNQEDVTPLSVQARNVAYFLFGRIVKSYIDPRRLIGRPFEFGTSHQGVLESFLYKAIQLKDGQIAADKLVSDLRNQGFAENVGFRVDGEVFNTDDTGAWGITITYNGKKLHLKPQDIYTIMEQGDKLLEELSAMQNKHG